MIKNIQKISIIDKVKKLEISPWFIGLCGVSLFQFIMSIRWCIIDKSPIQWDESGYMLQSTITYKAMLDKGVLAFIYQLFNYDRGRVNLVILLVQPFFKFFGLKISSAMISLNLCWFIIALSIYGIGKEIIDDKIGKLAGFLAFFFFGLYQFTTFLTHNFLVEFYLVTSVTVLYYFVMLFYRTKSIKYSYFIGMSVGLGLLIKVTFIAFLLPLLFLLYSVFKNSDSQRVFIRNVVPIITIPIILAGPYYAYNLKYIIKTTEFLSSYNLANLYGFGEIFNVSTILSYWKGIFIDPITLPITLISLVVFMLFLKKLFNATSKHKFCFVVLFTWFIVPVMLSTFGTIKDSRYLYPALVPLFLTAGVGISYLIKKNKFIGIMMILIVSLLPVYQFSVTNGLINRLGFLIDNHIKFEQPLDKNDWHLSQTVENINQYLNSKKEVVFLGGNKNYHLNLFRLYGIMQGININYSTIPYYNKDLTYADAIKYIMDLNPSGILYKTGENWPEFSNKYSKEIIEQLSNDSNYEKIDLNITQPDGSKLFMFVSKLKSNNIEKNIKLPTSEEINMKSNIDLSEKVKQDNENLLHLSGWGIVNNKDSANSKIFIVFKSVDKTVFINTNTMIRNDITKAFGSVQGKNFDNSGFDAYIPENLLQDGKYRIGICIVDGDNKYLNYTNTYITKNDKGIFRGFISDEESIPQYTVSDNIKYSIELVKNITDSDYETVEISGFAFIKNVSNLNSKTFITLKSKEKELIFDMASIRRPDVTKAFGENMNINDSGFQTFIPTNLLSNGDYQIGILIENGGKNYFQYTDKTFSK